jgi:hypothetical protein
VPDWVQHVVWWQIYPLGLSGRPPRPPTPSSPCTGSVGWNGGWTTPSSWERRGWMDAVTQYELWKAIWSSLNDLNFFELAHAFDRDNRLLAAFVPLTFVGNYDVTRLASQLHDQRHLAHALAILLTIGHAADLRRRRAGVPRVQGAAGGR